MNTPATISLLTQDGDIENEVAGLCDSDNGLSAAGLYTDLKRLAAGLERLSTSVALVDIDPDPVGMLKEMESMISNFDQTRFVVLTSDLTGDLVLKAMHVGVRHVQLKSSLPAELVQVLGRLVQSNTESRREGKVVTILSASGGCGATTLAVNLANEIRLGSKKPTLVVDLDYHYGAVAAYLDLSGKYGVADVMSHEDNIDSNLVASTALDYADNLDVLLSPASIDLSSAGAVPADKLEPLLDACRSAYACTLIDAPRATMDVAANLAKSSDATLIVQQLTIKDIRSTRAMLWELERAGVDQRQVRILVNRHVKRRQMITLQEVEKVLKGATLQPLSNDYRNIIRAINFGKPLAESAPRSSLRKELVKLAAELVEFGANKNGSKGR